MASPRACSLPPDRFAKVPHNPWRALTAPLVTRLAALAFAGCLGGASNDPDPHGAAATGGRGPSGSGSTAGTSASGSGGGGPGTASGGNAGSGTGQMGGGTGSGGTGGSEGSGGSGGKDSSGGGASGSAGASGAGGSGGGSAGAGSGGETGGTRDANGEVPPASAGTCPPGRNVVFRLDLADPNWNGGATGVTAAIAALGSAVMAGAANASVVPDPEYGRALKVAYPARSGSISCVEEKKCAVHGGLVFRVPIPNGPSITSAVLSYRVKFETGFEWVKGGKLPGLCGAECSTGGREVNPDRFSIRYMWRGGGTAMVYSYLTNPPNNGTGLDIGVGTWRWQNDGQWHQIQEELILNTGNANDGIIRVWYDKPMTSAPNFERKDLKYYDRVKYPALGIDKLIFSTFHGGEDASWSPSKDVHAYFTDLTICR